MATAFKLSVVAPDRAVAEVDAISAVVPGLEGYFGIMAGHEPIIAALRPGLLEFVSTENQRHFVAIGGGFAEVSSGKMTVLADDAHMANEIDVAKMEAEIEEARKALRGENSTMTAADATLTIEKAVARIKAAKRAS